MNVSEKIFSTDNQIQLNRFTYFDFFFIFNSSVEGFSLHSGPLVLESGKIYCSDESEVSKIA